MWALDLASEWERDKRYKGYISPTKVRRKETGSKGTRITLAFENIAFSGI
jgi:hypothetical protein